MLGSSEEKQQGCPVLFSTAAGMGSDLEEGSVICWEVPGISMRRCSDLVQLCIVTDQDQL